MASLVCSGPTELTNCTRQQLSADFGVDEHHKRRLKGRSVRDVSEQFVFAPIRGHPPHVVSYARPKK